MLLPQLTVAQTESLSNRSQLIEAQRSVVTKSSFQSVNHFLFRFEHPSPRTWNNHSITDLPSLVFISPVVSYLLLAHLFLLFYHQTSLYFPDFLCRLLSTVLLLLNTNNVCVKVNDLEVEGYIPGVDRQTHVLEGLTGVGCTLAALEGAERVTLDGGKGARFSNRFRVQSPCTVVAATHCNNIQPYVITYRSYLDTRGSFHFRGCT